MFVLVAVAQLMDGLPEVVFADLTFLVLKTFYSHICATL